MSRRSWKQSIDDKNRLLTNLLNDVDGNTLLKTVWHVLQSMYPCQLASADDSIPASLDTNFYLDRVVGGSFLKFDGQRKSSAATKNASALYLGCTVCRRHGANQNNMWIFRLSAWNILTGNKSSSSNTRRIRQPNALPGMKHQHHPPLDDRSNPIDWIWVQHCILTALLYKF